VPTQNRSWANSNTRPAPKSAVDASLCRRTPNPLQRSCLDFERFLKDSCSFAVPTQQPSTSIRPKLRILLPKNEVAPPMRRRVGRVCEDAAFAKLANRDSRFPCLLPTRNHIAALFSHDTVVPQDRGHAEKLQTGENRVRSDHRFSPETFCALVEIL